MKHTSLFLHDDDEASGSMTPFPKRHVGGCYLKVTKYSPTGPHCLGVLLLSPPMGRYRLLLLSLSSTLVSLIHAQPAQVHFEDCTSAATRSASDYDPNAQINISSVYAQVAYPNGQKTLRIRAVASTNEDVEPSETDSSDHLILCTSSTLLSIDHSKSCCRS